MANDTFLSPRRLTGLLYTLMTYYFISFHVYIILNPLGYYRIYRFDQVLSLV